MEQMIRMPIPAEEGVDEKGACCRAPPCVARAAARRMAFDSMRPRSLLCTPSPLPCTPRTRGHPLRLPLPLRFVAWATASALTNAEVAILLAKYTDAKKTEQGDGFQPHPLVRFGLRDLR